MIWRAQGALDAMQIIFALIVALIAFILIIYIVLSVVLLSPFALAVICFLFIKTKTPLVNPADPILTRAIMALGWAYATAVTFILMSLSGFVNYWLPPRTSSLERNLVLELSIMDYARKSLIPSAVQFTIEAFIVIFVASTLAALNNRRSLWNYNRLIICCVGIVFLSAPIVASDDIDSVKDFVEQYVASHAKFLQIAIYHLKNFITEGAGAIIAILQETKTWIHSSRYNMFVIMP